MRPVALASVMVVALVACGGPRDLSIHASGPTSLTEETRHCSISGAAYTVHYPATWSTVDDGPVPCRFFHPEDFELPQSTEAAGLAINVQLAAVRFDEIVPSPAGGTAVEKILSRRTGQLSGRRAARIESRTLLAGLLPAGVRRVTWYVDAGSSTLVATTSAAASAGTFAGNAEVLDGIVGAVELRPEQLHDTRWSPAGSSSV